MWFFGKDKDKTKGTPDKAAASSVPASSDSAKPMTSKEAKSQALLAQMRILRAEIGEENLEKIVNKLKLDALKKQIRDDIDNDPKKRDRLLDELRLHVRDDDKPGG